MTENHRDRPQHTGVIIDPLVTGGGVHCETTALGVLLAGAGLRLSEPMRFGLGSGLSFIYWDSRQQELPFLGGRVKPFTLTQNLTARLDLELREQQTSSPAKAWANVQRPIDEGTPVGLQLDSHDLDYFSSRVHFAGHVVAMYGYDEERVHLVDTAQQGGRVMTSRESLARARAARGPVSARHRSFTVHAKALPSGSSVPASAILSAITACAEDFLSPPIANLGHRGIRTAAARVRSLLERVSDPQRDLPAIATIMERAGTGGALFRNLYRDFLAECVDVLGSGPESAGIDSAREDFARSALLWTEVAGSIEQAGRTGARDHLTRASEQLTEIAEIEIRAMTTLREL